ILRGVRQQQDEPGRFSICSRQAAVVPRILMHAVKTEPARFWRVFGWFVACFTGFPSETP
ncbi:hypothetical protein DMR33_30295, partial [Klebsiella pneumoniae]